MSLPTDDTLIARLDALEKRVRELEDEREIAQAFYRYNRAVDYSGDVVAFGAAFADDAVSVVKDTAGTVIHQERGIEEIHHYQSGSAARRSAIPKHVALAPLAKFVGDTIEVENYFISIVDAGRGPAMNVYGRARNVLARRGGGWRIIERDATVESTTRA
jgi:hypothetical protein